MVDETNQLVFNKQQLVDKQQLYGNRIYSGSQESDQVTIPWAGALTIIAVK
jgi:hypothetical protein